MHVVPMETPNRKFAPPLPMVFHPELYPEIAKFNPEPSNFEIPKKKSTRVRNPAVNNFSIVSAPVRFNALAAIGNPLKFTHRGLALDLKNQSKLEDFKEHLHDAVSRIIGPETSC